MQVRHRKSGKEGTLRGVADLDREEVSERTGAVNSTGTWRRTTMRATWCRTA
ncbi:MAG: hypothetical protein ACLSVD_04870 [Eggerthellaceae bacterium]